MLKTATTLMLTLLFCNAARAEVVKCNAEPLGQTFLTEKFNYRVVGSGRLFLHSGPNEKCINKNLFVIPGDELTAYYEYGKDAEWSNVTFNSKDGKDSSGWVLTSRLMFTGAFGMEMTPEKVKFYEKAAAAARAGKLGAP